MSDPWQRTYDIFVTHAWRYHDDWNRFADLMNAVAQFRWRNFSVPWYDPAVDVHTEAGRKYVITWLENQIIPCQVVVALDSVYAVKSARQWVDEEIRLARQHGKPIFALPAYGAEGASAAVATLADRVLSWDGRAIAEAILHAAPAS